MTPGERMRWANREILRRRVDLYAAEEALAEAEMDWHLARFIDVSASVECPTCGATPGSFCALFRGPDGSYSWGREWRPEDRLVALGLHPARTTTPDALEAAR